MKTATQRVQELQEIGWRRVETKGTVYAFNKECAGDVDVIVSIRKIDSGYEVFSSSEHRCSGPSEAIVATATTIEESLEKTVECCKSWDKRADTIVDWSKWKLISSRPGGCE